MIRLTSDDLTLSEMRHSGFEPGSPVLEFGIEVGWVIHPPPVNKA
jgi:hypothetical protein